MATTSACWASSARASSSGPGSRASMTSRKPRSASARERARPRPRDAPVTMTVSMATTLRRGPPGANRELVLGLRVHDALAHRVQRRLGAIGEAQLGEDVAHVRLDGLL